MQQAIDTWDGLSKQYNEIMAEAERTTQILEDPSWPGRDLVSSKKGLHTVSHNQVPLFIRKRAAISR
jgi:hypothetical protein